MKDHGGTRRAIWILDEENQEPVQMTTDSKPVV